LLLKQLYKQFPTQVHCIRHLELVRWNGKPTCPYCEPKKKATVIQRENRYRCNDCNTSYSVTAKTLFHKTKVDLQKWFCAIPLVMKERISARQLAKKIEVTKDTACFMVQRIRIAYKEEPELIKHFLN
jgi:transposase-like protein